MEDAIINHVSDTALWIAAFRAEETQRSDAAFKDTLAKKLAGEKGYAIMNSTPHKNAMAFAMVVRTSAIDRLVNSAVGKGVDTVVNVGAGLDTRPYRMKLPPSLQWIEVDLPGIQAYKAELLKDEKPVCKLEIIACDLAVDAKREKVFAQLGAVAKKALVITEGLIAYLDKEQARKLSRSIYKVPSFCYWVMDYSQGKMARHRRARNLKKMVTNAPFKFGEDKPIEFFGQDGWYISENIFILEEAKRISRKFPLMFPWNILLRLIKKVRIAANKTYGYVMFGKQ